MPSNEDTSEFINRFFARKNYHQRDISITAAKRWCKMREREDEGANYQVINASRNNEQLKEALKNHVGSDKPLYLIIDVPTPASGQRGALHAVALEIKGKQVWCKDSMQGQELLKPLDEKVKKHEKRMASLDENLRRTFPKDIIADILSVLPDANIEVDDTPQQNSGEYECSYWALLNIERRRMGAETLPRPENPDMFFEQIRTYYGLQVSKYTAQTLAEVIPQFVDRYFPDEPAVYKENLLELTHQYYLNNVGKFDDGLASEGDDLANFLRGYIESEFGDKRFRTEKIPVSELAEVANELHAKFSDYVLASFRGP